jgi:hypothetical protein
MDTYSDLPPIPDKIQNHVTLSSSNISVGER